MELWRLIRLRELQAQIVPGAGQLNDPHEGQGTTSPVSYGTR